MECSDIILLQIVILCGIFFKEKKIFYSDLSPSSDTIQFVLKLYHAEISSYSKSFFSSKLMIPVLDGIGKDYISTKGLELHMRLDGLLQK
jgi:hypothetical protein